MSRLLTIVVQDDDIEEAHSAVINDHHERCISSDECGCLARAERLQAAIDLAKVEWGGEEK